MSSPIDDAMKTQFETDGFLVLRQFLPADEFEQLTKNLERYLREVVPTLPDAHAYYQDRTRPETLSQLQKMDVDPYFKAYPSNRHWLEAAEALLGEAVEAQTAEWFNKPPGTEHPTPPHQDNFYWKLDPPQAISMWLALDHVDEENGCLHYVRGSHRVPLRPHGPTSVIGFSLGVSDYGPADAAQEVPIRMAPNDLAIHHGDLIHRAGPNRSATRSRRAFAMNVNGASARADEAALAEYRASMQAHYKRQGLTV